MTTEILDKPKVEEKPLKVLHESCFWDEDDPRWMWMNGTDTPSISNNVSFNMVNEYHDICLGICIVCCTLSGIIPFNLTTCSRVRMPLILSISRALRFCSNVSACSTV